MRAKTLLFLLLAAIILLFFCWPIPQKPAKWEVSLENKKVFVMGLETDRGRSYFLIKTEITISPDIDLGAMGKASWTEIWLKDKDKFEGRGDIYATFPDEVYFHQPADTDQGGPNVKLLANRVYPGTYPLYIYLFPATEDMVFLESRLEELKRYEGITVRVLGHWAGQGGWWAKMKWRAGELWGTITK